MRTRLPVPGDMALMTLVSARIGSDAEKAVSWDIGIISAYDDGGLISDSCPRKGLMRPLQDSRSWRGDG